MVNTLAIFWIVVTVLTTVSLGVIANPISTEVFAQGNTTSGMMTEYSGNMTSTSNTTSTDDCDENATSTDDCGSGSISRSASGRIVGSPTRH